MTTHENTNPIKNNLENSEVPKVTPENLEPKEISNEKFSDYSKNEGVAFKNETAEEMEKSNSVNLDEETFEKVKNETGVEGELAEIDKESEKIIAESQQEINQDTKTPEEIADNQKYEERLMGSLVALTGGEFEKEFGHGATIDEKGYIIKADGTNTMKMPSMLDYHAEVKKNGGMSPDELRKSIQEEIEGEKNGKLENTTEAENEVEAQKNIETGQGSPEASSNTKNELSSKENRETAENFDNKFADIITENLKSEKISPEEANEILSLSEKLDPEDKEKILKDIEAEKSDFDGKKKLSQGNEGTQESESDMSEWEKEMSNLADRAKAVGIEFSPEQILSYINLTKKLGIESGEKNPNSEQRKELDESIGELSKKVEELEKMKKAGESDPEKEKKIKQDSTKIVEKLVTKAVSYVVKLLMRSAMGVIKGVAKGISESVKTKQ